MANAAPNKIVGNGVPAGMASLDQASGVTHAIGDGQYTAITTNGTTTLNGPAGQTGGVYYGAQLYALGTSPVITVYDVVGTNTQQIMNGTGTAANQNFTPLGSSLGVRCKGNIVVVTAGTAAGSWLNLWD
jgi:hypothetical protein